MSCSSALLDASIINSNSVTQAVRLYPDIGEFLHGDHPVALHSTTIPDPASVLDFYFDIDGLCIEFGKLQALQGGMHYLLLPTLRLDHMVPQYQFIKKHLDLTRYSEAGLTALRHAVGHTVSYIDGGYHLVMTVLPKDPIDPDTRLLKRDLYSVMAKELLTNVIQNFQEMLRMVSDKDKARASIRSQSSFDTARYRVLRRDAVFIASLLDAAIEKANKCCFMSVALFLAQYGQKDQEPLDLTDIVDPSSVRSVSVHLACNIVAKDPKTHILFSRCGLEALVGVRGTFYSALGMHEATNFQSNLDNKEMDVSRELLRVLRPHGKLTFLQLYVDSPHAHLKMPFRHPVSGAIVTCGLSHPNVGTALRRRAFTYLQHMKELKAKMTGQLHARVEEVVRFEGEVLANIDPAEHFNMTKLLQLFEVHPIVLPFKDCGETGLLSVMRDVFHFLAESLTTCYKESEGIARYDACWKAFQYELAMEELIHGRPLSPVDYQLSVSLGTSTVSEKSLTHQRGFIGLAPHSSASADETPPPLEHWTRDRLQNMRIQRMFPLCQTLDAAPSVTGVALITVLLCDIYRRNTEIPMAALKSKNPPGRLVGAWKLDTLCQDLAEKNSFPVPNTFGRARVLVTQAGKDVKDCLMKGFVEARFNYFPSFKFRDVKGTKRLWWNERDYVQVHLSDAQLFTVSAVATMTMLVCVEVERRSLSYSRNLEKYRDHGMVWMEKVLTRLPAGLKKAPNTMLTVVTFVSCIGMIMNGDYVDYNHLRELLVDMSKTFSQKYLQQLQILSHITLQKVFSQTIWKLREDIPYRVVQPKVPAAFKKTPEVRAERELIEEDVQAVEPQDDLRPMTRSKSKYLPVHTTRTWSALELSFVITDRGVKYNDAYAVFQKRCIEAHITVRTKVAFERKRHQLMKKEGAGK